VAQRPAGLPEIPAQPPLLVVLSAPSGAGKDTVLDLIRRWGYDFTFAVTMTTRAPRPGEKGGIDYHFATESEFDRLIAEDGLLEHAVVYGRKYGVPKAEVLEPLARGETVLVRVDVQGAATLKRLVPDALLIFVAPPSIEEALRRMRDRALDSDSEVEKRIAIAPYEMQEAAKFDHVVVNETDRAEATARRVVELIAETKRLRGR
jgi:guanylate kinase